MTAAGPSRSELPAWLHRLAAGLGSGDWFGFAKFSVPPPDARPSAVLLLFGEGPDGPDVLLIQRAEELRSHAGQPAFPGGAVDPLDAGPEDTALREAAEEVGLDRSGVQVLGLLPDLYLPPTGFLVTPVVAWWRHPSPVGVKDPAEVARVERVPIAELVDPRNRCRVPHSSGFIGPAFVVRDMIVWGFTGGLLAGVLELAGWAVPWNPDEIRHLPQRALDLAARSMQRTAPAGGPLGAEPDGGPAADDVVPRPNSGAPPADAADAGPVPDARSGPGRSGPGRSGPGRSGPSTVAP